MLALILLSGIATLVQSTAAILEVIVQILVQIFK